MGRKTFIFAGLLLLLLCSACSAVQGTTLQSPQALLTNKLNVDQLPTATPRVNVPRQVSTATSPSMLSQQQVNGTSSSTPPAQPIASPIKVPSNGNGATPYGQPPEISAEEIQLTQQLFYLINSDRAALGLSPLEWNFRLAGGARLHSWNMYHCGFSHTCPDGRTPCTRMANQGFTNVTNCAENIGEANSYPGAWDGVYSVEESMMHAGSADMNYIHLTSTTLHRIGIGFYVEPNGWILFTEDMVS